MTTLTFNMPEKKVIISRDNRKIKVIKNVEQVIQDFNDGFDYAIIKLMNDDQYFVNKQGKIIGPYSNIVNGMKHEILYYLVSKYYKDTEETYFGLLDLKLNKVLDTKYVNARFLPMGLILYESFSSSSYIAILKGEEKLHYMNK